MRDLWRRCATFRHQCATSAISARLSAVHARLSAISARLTAISARLTAISARLSDLLSANGGIYCSDGGCSSFISAFTATNNFLHTSERNVCCGRCAIIPTDDPEVKLVNDACPPGYTFRKYIGSESVCCIIRQRNCFGFRFYFLNRCYWTKCFILHHEHGLIYIGHDCWLVKHSLFFKHFFSTNRDRCTFFNSILYLSTYFIESCLVNEWANIYIFNQPIANF